MLGLGLAVGHKGIGLEFDANRPYTFCRLCGVVFQPRITDDELLRREWSFTHARTHSTSEHRALALSGQFLTPEAAYKLAPFGVISIGELVLSPEHEAAYREAKRIPDEDARGS